jgi:hypothetical protein
MKQLDVWQGIGLLLVALQLGLIGRFWLEGMVLGTNLAFGAQFILMAAMGASKHPAFRWLLVVAWVLSVFSWVSNFTIGVGS